MLPWAYLTSTALDSRPKCALTGLVLLRLLQLPERDVFYELALLGMFGGAPVVPAPTVLMHICTFLPTARLASPPGHLQLFSQSSFDNSPSDRGGGAFK